MDSFARMIAPRMAVATSFEHFTPKPTCPLKSPIATNAYRYPFNSLVSTTIWESQHQQGKPSCILMKQDMMGWHGEWHPLDHTKIICSLLQNDNHASSTSTLNFYRRDGLPDIKSLKTKQVLLPTE